MNVLVVLCHPSLTSYNGRIARAVCEEVESKKHRLRFHDLYRERFDPIVSESELRQHFSFDPQIQSYMDDVTLSDVLIFIHPDWWGQMPALLKGWIDRVFRPGITYDYQGPEFGPKEAVPLLQSKRGLAICTTDQSEDKLPHPLKRIWELDILGYCGAMARCMMLYNMHETGPSLRRQRLDIIREEVKSLLSPCSQ